MKRYPGTIPFTIKHKDLFFGRENEMTEVNQLSELEQLVVLYGKSGLGKSSLIQAGIIPTIIEYETYIPIYIRLTAFKGIKGNLEVTPTQITKENIQKDFNQPTFINELRPKENSLWSAAKNRQINGGGHRLILLFDQFEELFQYSERAIEEFLRELRELMNTAIPQRIRDEINKQPDDYLTEEQEDIFYDSLEIKTVFIIRSDRMHLLNKLARSLPQILSNNFELQPLALEDAKSAIVKPAQKEGDYDTAPFEYTDSALDKILDFLKDEETNRIEAFQLQLLCQTFEQKVKETGLKVIGDNEVQDLENIIDSYFQNNIQRFTPEEQKKLRQLIAKELVSPDGHVRYSIFEQKLKSDYDISEELLNQLIDLRLLRRERTNRGLIYEISHDTFLKAARQIKQDLEEQTVQEALAKAEAEMKAAKEQEALQRKLYEKAEEQREIADKASKEATRNATRSEIISLVAVAFLVVAIITSVWSVRSKQKADAEKQKAENALNTIIIKDAKAKALRLKDYGDSYKIYGQDDFACDSYHKADSILNTFATNTQYSDLKGIHEEIRKLYKKCNPD